MDTGSFIVHIKKQVVYADLAKDVVKGFDTSNDEVYSPLPVAKNKKVIGLMTDELSGRIMKEVVVLRSKMYSYLSDNGSVDKKERKTKKCVIKH